MSDVKRELRQDEIAEFEKAWGGKPAFGHEYDAARLIFVHACEYADRRVQHMRDRAAYQCSWFPPERSEPKVSLTITATNINGLDIEKTVDERVWA